MALIPRFMWYQVYRTQPDINPPGQDDSLYVLEHPVVALHEMDECETPRKLVRVQTEQLSVLPQGSHVQDSCISSSEEDEKFQLRQKHALDMLSLMKSMLDRKVLCDVKLKVKGQSFHAHRLVLSACSPYFNAMFTSQLKECHQDTVTLCDLEPEAIKEIVDFAYSGKVNLTEHNVQSVLNSSCVLQIEPIVSLCCDFLKTQLHPTNCLGICKFADSHGCFDLKRAAELYVHQNFTKVATHEEFLLLTSKDLISIIEHDDLNVKSEEEVYLAVMKWLNHDRKSREQFVGEIFEYVRLPLMSWEFLIGKVTEDNVMSLDKNCSHYFEQARRYHASEFYPGLHWEVNVRTIPRHSFNNAQFIYVVGGETRPSRQTLNTVERYQPALNNWITLPSMDINRRGVGVAVLDNLMYAVGGANETALKEVESFNIQTERWRSVAPMNEARSSVAVAVIRGHLYAIGGYDGMTSLRTVECYDPYYNEWTKVADMHNARSMAAAVVHENCIYAIGGYNGSSDLNSVECFRVISRDWVESVPMFTARSVMAAVSVKDKIYVVGGCGQSGSLSTVEVFIPREQTWYQIKELSNPRSGLGLAVINNQIYALGGYNGSYNLQSVEKYDEREDKWKIVSNMQMARCRFGCCWSK